ncbi:hypothetical protein QQ045_020044 [Rhodiola kirilowii]
MCTSVDNIGDSGIRHWIPKYPDEFKPRLGMVFKNIEDAIKFYKHCAYIAGFSVQLSTSSTSLEGIVIHKYLVCHREGYKEKSTVVETVNLVEHSERHIRDNRCGCLARLCLNIIDGGLYRVYSFEEFHNHWLADDIGKQYLNENRQLSVVHQNIIMQCGKYRIGATTVHHLVKDLCGGFSNLGATVTNFKRDLKLYIGHNDPQMIVDSLSNKKNTWHGYNLVFVPFTGVDNHHRSVTLAAGLISRRMLIHTLGCSPASRILWYVILVLL